jgi:hypothetical protein
MQKKHTFMRVFGSFFLHQIIPNRMLFLVPLKLHQNYKTIFHFHRLILAHVFVTQLCCIFCSFPTVCFLCNRVVLIVKFPHLRLDPVLSLNSVSQGRRKGSCLLLQIFNVKKDTLCSSFSHTINGNDDK